MDLMCCNSADVGYSERQHTHMLHQLRANFTVAEVMGQYTGCQMQMLARPSVLCPAERQPAGTCMAVTRPPHSVSILVHVIDLSGVSRACRRMSRMGRGWVATRRGPVARRRGWVAGRTQAVAGLSWGVADGSRTGREAVAGPSRLSRLGRS